LILIGACRDSLRPELRGASIRIYQGSAPYDEQTLAPGDGMQLTARVLDASGEWLRSERVTWRVAGGDAVLLGSEGGVVALAPGTAEVIASHAVGEDTARVTVADAVRDPVTCDVVTEFGIGEVRQFAGPEAVGICLPGREEGFAEYVVTLANLG